MMRRGAQLAVILALAGATHAGTVLRVDDDAPAGGDGLTWDTAYRYLRDAITAAEAIGIVEVRVAQGTYRPDEDEACPDGSGDRALFFTFDLGVTLRGGYAGIGAADPDERDVDAFVTTLSGDLAQDDSPGFVNRADNSYRVTSGSSSLSAEAILDGFTVTAGHADGEGPWDDAGGGLLGLFGDLLIIDCTFHDNYAETDGGAAAIIDKSNARFIGCEFHDNVAGDNGGGVFGAVLELDTCIFTGNVALDFDGGGAELNGNVFVTDCAFSNNTSDSDGGGLVASSAVVTGCEFIDNAAEQGGGVALSFGSVTGSTFTGNSATEWGGALAINDVDVTNCVFEGNSADLLGGAITGTGDTSLTDCTFTGNTATFFGGGVYDAGIIQGCVLTGNQADIGGGLHLLDEQPLISGCRFTGNTASSLGGGVFFSQSGGVMVSCLLDGNTSGFTGGAVQVFQGAPQLVNCTIIDNSASGQTGGVFSQLGGAPVLTSCVLWGNTDPGLSVEQAQIGHVAEVLTTVSYCDVQGWTGALGGTGNFGDDPLFADAEGRLSAGSPCIDAGDNKAVPPEGDPDLDGNPRFADDPCTTDTGNGVSPIVDIGAYEFPGSSVPADLDGDCLVGTTDMLILLGSWGPCPDPPDPCPADLDGDGEVSTPDFLSLLKQWSFPP